MSAEPVDDGLTVGDRIRNLLGTYCERIDAGDFAGVGELFARGGLAAGAPDAPPFVTGAEAVRAFYEGGTRLHDGSPRTKHVVADTVLAGPAADGSVTARSSYVVFQATDELPLQAIIAGRYVDRFEQDGDGSWWFARRHFAVDLMGDLSHHWAGPTG
ncbi:MAG TPA: nuclear transport factor 2 family protein [Aquihabitans sp.]|jgi:ketosteroid isomerase-like protein|nr:nuclear transport factor 2 family protein [Aquihabitans sp.]